jgi:hypothetical protein
MTLVCNLQTLRHFSIDRPVMRSDEGYLDSRAKYGLIRFDTGELARYLDHIVLNYTRAALNVIAVIFNVNGISPAAEIFRWRDIDPHDHILPATVDGLNHPSFQRDRRTNEAAGRARQLLIGHIVRIWRVRYARRVRPALERKPPLRSCGVIPRLRLRGRCRL